MTIVRAQREELIAPCGMNCAVCSRYLAHVNNLKRSQCIGCRPRGKKCAYLFRECGEPRDSAGRKARFCFACREYPCERIDHMDKRYRAHYGMSVKENLELIRDKGVRSFLRAQAKKYRCSTCSGMISTHNGKCFRCEPITSLVEKGAAERRFKAKDKRAKYTVV